jgi:exodeoxyribonuclease-3
VLTVSSVNVNGIRAAFRRGMGSWLEQRHPDVLLLQEVRASDDVVRERLGPDWHLVHQSSDTKGRAGVAIATRLPMAGVRVGLADGAPEPPSDTGRWVEADLALPGGQQVTVVSTYLHSATAGTPSMDEKYAYLDKVTARLAAISASGAHAVVGGDVNIAHTEADIKNWKGNLKHAGFLPRERAYLDRWTLDLGWVDLGRRFGGDGPGPFTWWSWRGKAFDNDAGWRIDYQFASASLAPMATTAVVDRAASYDTRFSDHAPVSVTYDL